jgi:ABC-type transport system involved in multi-copper enzyme maturation permease subunit
VSALLLRLSVRLRQTFAWSNSPQAWAERTTTLLLFAALALLASAGGFLALGPRVALAGLFVLAVALLLRRGWLKLFGPVLFYEMLRTGRQGRYATVRTLYALFLFFAMLLTYVLWWASTPLPFLDAFTKPLLPGDGLAEFALVFFVVFMVVQMFAVFVLTPAYLAGAIAEEKDRRTLEALLVTDLLDREIVFGMVLARLANLTLVFLVGLPILSGLQFLGGVDPDLVLAGFAFVGLTLLGLAGLSIFNSLWARKPREAIVRTYLMALAYLGLSSASWLLLWPRLGLATFPSTDDWVSPVQLEDVVRWGSVGNPWAVAGQLVYGVSTGGALDRLLAGALREYAWFHGLLAALCFGCAALGFRAGLLGAGGGAATGGLLVRLGLRGPRRLPPVSDRALLWKELHVEAGSRRRLGGLLWAGLLTAAVFGPALYLFYFYGSVAVAVRNDRLADYLNLWVRAVALLLGSAMLLQVAVQAAGAVSGERDRDTLDSLLATPLDNHSILFTKWLGSIVSPRGAGSCLGLVWLLGLVCGALHPLAVPAFLGAWLVYAAFVASLGLFFSVLKPRSHAATFWTVFALLGVLLASVLAAQDVTDWWLTGHEAVTLVPPAALGLLAFSPANYRLLLAGQTEESLRALPFSLAFWAVWAWALFALTGRRFQVAFGRKPGAASRGKWPSALRMLWSPVPPVWHAWPRRLVRFAVVALPCGLLAVFLVPLHEADQAHLRTAIARADRLDPGWRLEDLEAARAVVPDGRNSVPRILAALKLLPSPWPNPDLDKALEKWPAERELTPQRAEQLRRELRRAQNALHAARMVADLPEGYVPIAWTDDVLSTLLGDIQQTRTLARLLSFDVMLRLHDRDVDGALTSSRGILNCARAVGDAPLLIGMFMRTSQRSLTAHAVERVLAQGEPSEQALAELQRLLEDEGRQPLLLQALRGERAGMNRLAENLRGGKVKSQFLYGPPLGRKSLLPQFQAEEVAVLLSGSLARQHAALLEHFTELVEAAKLPEPLQDAQIARVQKPLNPRMGLLGLLAPAVGRAAGVHRSSVAQLRSLVTALAVERYRLRTGHWPQRLADLVPEYLVEPPADPFDGKPLRYRRLADGVVVYSVGLDGVDDGGTFDPERRQLPGTDIGVRLWDPGRRRQAPVEAVGPPPP